MGFHVYSYQKSVTQIYTEYKEEYRKKQHKISDEKTSFYIKAIMIGMPLHIYFYKNKIVKGGDILAAIFKCFFDTNFKFSRRTI